MKELVINNSTHKHLCDLNDICKSGLEGFLHDSLNELYYNGFEEDFSLAEQEIIKKLFVPKKQYGTAMVTLCFVNYFYSLLNQ